MDNERSLLLRKKLDMQQGKNMLKAIDGITVLDIFDIESNEGLLENSRKYFKAWHKYEISPIEKMRVKSSSTNELCQWIIQTTDIEQDREYYFLCGGLLIQVWGEIRIDKLHVAIESMLNNDDNRLFLIDVISNKIYHMGCDSSDEYNYLLYIN